MIVAVDIASVVFCFASLVCPVYVSLVGLHYCKCTGSSNRTFNQQHFLYFFPLLHGQRSFLPCLRFCKLSCVAYLGAWLPHDRDLGIESDRMVVFFLAKSQATATRPRNHVTQRLPVGAMTLVVTWLSSWNAFIKTVRLEQVVCKWKTTYSQIIIMLYQN